MLDDSYAGYAFLGLQAAFRDAGLPGLSLEVSLCMKVISSHPTTEDPDLAERFDRVLGDVVQALEEEGLKYVFIGGIASGGLGRPRTTHDIDIFVMPEESELTLRALEKRGFRTERTDPHWLYKAFKEDILVDVIFKSKGEIYLDSEMYQRITLAEFRGRRLRLVSPEDLVIIKAAAHSELTPSHWHDAIALLSYAALDWKYLLKRARRAPRRILSLLLYAQSNDIWVPNSVIEELYCDLFEASSVRPGHQSRREPTRWSEKLGTTQTAKKEIREQELLRNRKTPSQIKFLNQKWDPHYAMAHLKEQLANDPRLNELDIQVERQENRILLRGEVAQRERREVVEEIAREVLPGVPIENQIQVSRFQGPFSVEEIQ